MIEIAFNHRTKDDILFIDKLSIGHGLPEHGQLDFISFIKEESSMITGVTVYATYKWGFGWWGLKNRRKGKDAENRKRI